MLPTFIVAGAAKSGTSAIYEYLKPHPQICMAWMKEPNFFTQQGRQAGYHKGLPWYQSLFQANNQHKAIGDVSPSLMTRKDAAKLISKIVPQVQLLFILREPVDRVYSQYRYALHRGHQLPAFEQMIRNRDPFLQNAIYDSSYHLHLKRFLEIFPPENVLVFIYEDWRSNPDAFMNDLYQKVGVDPGFTPPNLGKRYNPSQNARFPWIQRNIGRLAPAIMKFKLSPGLFAILRKLRQAIWQLNSVNRQAPVLAHELGNELRLELIEVIDFVENYINRSLPLWRGQDDDA